MRVNYGITARKLVLQTRVSLDDLVAPWQARRRGLGLPPEDPALKQRKLDWLRDTDLHLMGRAEAGKLARVFRSSRASRHRFHSSSSRR
ncbi:MAG TPA: hypothetical protein VHC69_21885 [Polyangiaceae bacterium]|nr:hypothetical protein [Polyangiaceae bacterium]